MGLTTENLSCTTLNGTDKSMNGALKLWSDSNKLSCANTQDTTKPQLKLKSTNSTISSENKPRSGSVSKKTNSTVKSNATTVASFYLADDAAVAEAKAAFAAAFAAAE